MMLPGASPLACSLRSRREIAKLNGRLTRLSVAWLLPLMLTACFHKTQQAQVHALAPPLADAQRRRADVGFDELADTVAIVDLRSPERRCVDLLAERFAHDPGARQEHRRILGHHDQVGQRGRVGAAARRGATPS